MCIDEMEIVFDAAGEEESVQSFEGRIEQMGKSSGMEVKKFKELFTGKFRIKSGALGGRYIAAAFSEEPEMEKAYDFLRSCIDCFPNLEIYALWNDTTRHDEPFYGSSYWSYSDWQEENDGGELPDDFRNLFDFDGTDTATPYEWLVDWVEEHQDDNEAIGKFFAAKCEEYGVDYDEENVYDNCKLLWNEFFVIFPEARAEFIKYVESL
jgi:hypothetical protein